MYTSVRARQVVEFLAPELLQLQVEEAYFSNPEMWLKHLTFYPGLQCSPWGVRRDFTLASSVPGQAPWPASKGVSEHVEAQGQPATPTEAFQKVARSARQRWCRLTSFYTGSLSTACRHLFSALMWTTGNPEYFEVYRDTPPRKDPPTFWEPPCISHSLGSLVSAYMGSSTGWAMTNPSHFVDQGLWGVLWVLQYVTGYGVRAIYMTCSLLRVFCQSNSPTPGFGV